MDIRRELHEAPDEEDFGGPVLLAQVMSRLDEPPRSRSYPWQALIAAGLAVALVATFLVIRANRLAVNPADNGPTLPVAANISGVLSYQFVSSQIGWLNVYTPANDTVIARTSDGGRTWRRQLVVSGLSSTTTMQFFDNHDGVVIGQDGKVPTVWQTSDGGVSWRAHQVLVGSDQSRLALPGWWAVVSGYFLDAQHGWLLLGPDFGACSGCGLSSIALDALVYQTSDGGAHWSQLATLNVGTGTYWRGIMFVSPTTGFITTASSFARLPLYSSRDGGHSWVRVDLQAPPRGQFSESAPAFFSSQDAVLLVSVTTSTAQNQVYLGSRYLYSTTDGGRTWSGPEQVATDGYFDFIDPNHWILVSAGRLSATADAGKTWSAGHPIPLPSGWHASMAQFLNAQEGWVTLSDEDPSAANIAAHGTIGAVWPKFAMLSTSDGGVTWHEVPLAAL